jgi:peptidoglycan/xylan/chitin deacetylase (PgdA/CDA1 family)
MSAFRVALTFDTEHPDRPCLPGTTEALLDRLLDRRMRATFFIQGRWAETYPATVGRIVEEGHAIGNHSHYHVRMPLLTDAGLVADLADATTAIEAVAGVSPRPWFRCPFGAGADDGRVLAAVADAGYRHVGWHVAADDWEPDRGADVIERDIVDGVLAHGDGAVVLLHAWPTAMLEAFEPIVTRLVAAGARFVGVDELADPPIGVPG